MFSHNTLTQKSQTVLKLEHVEPASRHIIISHNKAAYKWIAGILLGCDVNLETTG